MAAPAYTEQELKNTNLPGFNVQFSQKLGAWLAIETAWQPVLNLAIISFNQENGQPQILRAIRTEENNDTHPNVISTPTRRIYNNELLRLLFQREKFIRAKPNQLEKTHSSEVVGTFTPRPHHINDRNSPAAFFARNCLKDKLGIDDFHNFNGTISMSQLVAGFADRDTKEHTIIYEPILMFGAVMMVDKPELFPTITQDYREIGWSPLSQFPDMVRRKAIGEIMPTLVDTSDEVMLCVRGQCIRTSISTTASEWLLSRHLGVQPANLSR